MAANQQIDRLLLILSIGERKESVRQRKLLSNDDQKQPQFAYEN